MKRPSVKITGAVVAAGIVIAGCASLTSPFRDPDERWADYKSWTKITEGRTGTGDPTGFIGAVHKGPEGYRDVYVNAVGKEAIEGSAPYNYPAGTVIVKEQFDDKAAWESGSKPGITVSLKVTDSHAPDKANWIWSDSYKGTAGQSAFCSSCHSIATVKDFVFTNGDYFAGS